MPRGNFFPTSETSFLYRYWGDIITHFHIWNCLFSQLLWLLPVLCTFVWILESTCLFPQELTCFPEQVIILLSYQQCMKDSYSHYLNQHLLLSTFFDYTSPSGCDVASQCDFSSTSLKTNDAEQFSCAYWPFLYFLFFFSIQTICSFLSCLFTEL